MIGMVTGMQTSYTKKVRQRQGRDFSVVDYLRNAEMSVEGYYNMVGDGIINNLPCPDEQTQKKSLLDRLEQAKGTAAEQETERCEPVDGIEPPERGRA